MKKAIERVYNSDVRPIKEGEAHYDCDFSILEPIANKGGPFSWKISESNTFNEIYNIKLDKL